MHLIVCLTKVNLHSSSMCLFCSHHSATELNTVERHWRVLQLFGPSFCPKRICFFRGAKSRAGNKGNVTPRDASVHPKYWLMKIFKEVMTATSSSNPLQNHRESCIGLYKIDDSLDKIDRSRLERDVFQPDRLNVFVGNLH